MITQAIKRWLSKLFAWWPWKRSSQAGYAQTVRNVNQGTTQDAVWRITVDGSASLPGITSVAVEQGSADSFDEALRSATDERFERSGQQALPSAPEESADPTCLTATDASNEIPASSAGESPPLTFEQQLAFLHYLVKRGIVNEGFAEDQVPKQYKRRS